MSEQDASPRPYPTQADMRGKVVSISGRENIKQHMNKLFSNSCLTFMTNCPISESVPDRSSQWRGFLFLFLF